MFLFTAHQRQTSSPKALLTSLSVSSTFVMQLFPLEIFVFFVFAFVRNVNSTPSHSWWTLSCCFLTWGLLGGWFVHRALPENVRRLSGVQCISESNWGVVGLHGNPQKAKSVCVSIRVFYSMCTPRYVCVWWLCCHSIDKQDEAFQTRVWSPSLQ